MAVKSPDLPIPSSATSDVSKRAKALEDQVSAAAEKIRSASNVFNPNDIMAQVAVQMAGTIRATIDAHVRDFNTLADRYLSLAAENRKLREKLRLVKPFEHTEDTDLESEDDSRLFGTHIREAWHVLTGR